MTIGVPSIQRLRSHNNGENKATKPYGPFDVIFYEAFKNKDDAKRREKYLKSTKGKRALKLMLQKYFNES
ncbi:MAG: GIY-YIG nuclease family protein [Candidatus Pacebacteria bacterium]|nr:GIY-YIG nuclease family protein [Candidatus Paceibacterota bacterium]